MNVLATVTLLMGVARSGTSWIGQVFNSAPDVSFRFQPLFSYEFKNRVDEDSESGEYLQLFRDLLAAETPFLTQRDKQEAGAYPFFQKGGEAPHLVLKENRYHSLIEPMLRRTTHPKVIGIVRNPCAVLNSWRKNAREFPPGSDLAREWRFGMCKNRGTEDYFGYYKWKEVANLYVDLEQQYPGRFRIVRYEETVADPVRVFAELFAFAGIDYGEQTKQFVEQSTSRHDDGYYSVYKASTVAEAWSSELDPYIIEQIAADLRATRLEVFLR
jgi:hypothetical protein